MIHGNKITKPRSQSWLEQELRGGGGKLLTKGHRDRALHRGPNDQSLDTTPSLDTTDDDAAVPEFVTTKDATTVSAVSDNKECGVPVVGVKSLSHHKKSNAVGDPDGDGSSDDDDDDDNLSDWDDAVVREDEEDYKDLDSVLERVQVEVEYTVEDDEDEDSSSSNAIASTSSGGVGVRLGQRFKGKGGSNKRAGRTAEATMKQHILAAWQPNVYLPPPDWTYLQEHSRTTDGDGKTRLDRRTLYAGLLLEWSATATTSSYRKFLDKDVSQALQAALSLATQPAWRKSLQRPSAIRLYGNDVAARGCTMAMQETIALALVCLQNKNNLSSTAIQSHLVKLLHFADRLIVWEQGWSY